jgi:Ferritin-like
MPVARRIAVRRRHSRELLEPWLLGVSDVRNIVAVDRGTLVSMLNEASELEHALCCQYLYAAFSLKAGGDPGLTPSQAMRAGQWEQQITKIAVQEMSHLMMASNILTSLGEAPHLSRPNFPQPTSRYSEIGPPSLLAALDLETVSRFTCWEKPEEPGWWDGWCRGSAADALKRLGLIDARAEPPPFSTIGQLYGVIDSTLKANPGWIDPAAAGRQVTSQLVPFSPKVSAVVTYEDAHRCISLIVEEGEGTPDWDSMSHFAYFHQIVNELTNAEAFAPAWATVDSPAYVPEYAPPGASRIDDPVATPVGILFNDLYLLLIQILSRLFLPEGENAVQRARLANLALALMPLCVKQLGTVLTRLPAGAQYPGQFAGPSFELPQPVNLPLGAHEQAWSGLSQHLAEVTSRCRVLTLDPPEGLPEGARAKLALVTKDLETVSPLLDHEAVGTR